MKQLLMLLFVLPALAISAQDKYHSTHFNRLTEVAGTDYVIATVENWSKTSGLDKRYLLFINTKNGETNQVNFPNDGHLGKVEQVKIDKLGINTIIVGAQTVDLDGRKGIDWRDPEQIIVLSTDGKQKTQLTDDKFFVRTWVINQTTGTIVVTGYYDTNNNNKFDNTDKNETAIYDLKTLKQVSKF